ncbi:MAG: hypothetical protein WD232_10835 [Acidimicrobiales bacterium]
MPRARGAGVQRTLGDSEVLEQGSHELVGLCVTSHHEAGAVARTGDPTARPRVEEPDAPLPELAVTADRMFPVGVPPVDDDIALLEALTELCHDLVGGFAVGDVHEGDPRRVERVHERSDRVHHGHACLLELVGALGIETDHLVALLHRLERQRGPHPPEPADPEPHPSLLLVVLLLPPHRNPAAT